MSNGKSFFRHKLSATDKSEKGLGKCSSIANKALTNYSRGRSKRFDTGAVGEGDVRTAPVKSGKLAAAVIYGSKCP
ncbi:hypothetical protein SK3146_02064 [Paenibacillus konkukensis]|uniref:Uncharacterized protein n=1 Tax=Paenibacillus konkukensis TaxID=2020716 RepID=A0ABY4RN75_9BACL|nr:hypothetical protein SK3146_02064 [Paenibacillus konkukensis]